MRWERVAHSDAGGPGKRWGHTCNVIKRGRYLYVFGGYGKDNCLTNLVHVFDSVTQKWSQPIVKGTAPTPRDSHSCTIISDNLVVFGGTDGVNPLKDLHILDTSSHTWISPSIRGEGPEAREAHSATLVGKRLFIFGGVGKSSVNNDVYYNDVYILNTETFVWKKAVTTGTPPSARDSHTCSSWKNKMIVIGGEDSYDYYLSDVYILDADTFMWKELKTSGRIQPRAGHSTVAFGKILFVFGGCRGGQNLYDDLYMLDIDAGIWTRVATTGQGPSARFSMAGDSLDPARSGVLFFIGGCDNSLEALDDIYYLHTGLVKQNLSLRKQLKLKCQEQSSLAPDRFGMGANTYQPMPMSVYGQPGPSHSSLNPLQQPKKAFQARIVNSMSGGFTIETVIDGKPLRGIMLSNKPSNLQIPSTIVPNPSRKRASVDMERATSTYGTAQTTGQRDSVDGKQREVVQLQQQGKDPTQTPLGTARTKAPIASPAVNMPTSASALDKVPATQDASANPADTNKVELGGVSRKDDKDGAPLKLDDVPREDDHMKHALMVADRTDSSQPKDDQKKGGPPERDDQIDVTPIKDVQREVRDNPPVTEEPDGAAMGGDETNDQEETNDATMRGDKTDDQSNTDNATMRGDGQAETDDATMIGDETVDSRLKDQTYDAPMIGDETVDSRMKDQTDDATMRGETDGQAEIDDTLRGDGTYDATMRGDETDDQVKTDDATLRGDETKDSPIKDQTYDATMRTDETDDQAERDDTTLRGDETYDATMRSDETDDQAERDDTTLRSDETYDAIMRGDETDDQDERDDATLKCDETYDATMRVDETDDQDERDDATLKCDEIYDATLKCDEIYDATMRVDETDDQDEKDDAIMRGYEIYDATMRSDETDNQPERDDATLRGDENEDSPMNDQTNVATMRSDETDDQAERDDATLRVDETYNATMRGDVTDDQTERDDATMRGDETDDHAERDDATFRGDETYDATMRGDETDDQAETDDATLRGDETDDSHMKDQRYDAPPVGDQTDTAPTRVDDNESQEVNQQVTQENLSSTVDDSVLASATQDDSLRIEDKAP